MKILSRLMNNGCCREALIVDDIAMNRFALRKLLKSHFRLRSLEASNGEECVSLLKEVGRKRCCKWLRVIFMDLEMPVMDGLQVSFVE